MEPTPEIIAFSHRMWCEHFSCKYIDKIDYRDPCVGCPEGHFGPWGNRGCEEAEYWKHIEKSRVGMPIGMTGIGGHSRSRFARHDAAFYISDGPGSELKKILSKLGLKPSVNCKCNKHIAEMNNQGPDWCEQNIDTIVGWLREEAARANLPFTKIGAKILVRKAIRNTRKKENEIPTQSANSG